MKKLFLLFLLPTFLFGQDVIRTWDNTTLIVENVTVNGVVSGRAQLEFDTVAQMEAFDFSQVANGARVKCNGYHTANDGKFGPDLFWNSTSTTTADGLSVFKADTVVTGRLIRTFTTPVNALWGGAKGDGVQDEVTFIQTALDYLEGIGGGVLYLPAGTYNISDHILMRDNTVLRGDGDSTIISNTNLSTGLFWSTTSILFGTYTGIDGVTDVFSEAGYDIQDASMGDNYVTLDTLGDASAFAVGDLIAVLDGQRSNSGKRAGAAPQLADYYLSSVIVKVTKIIGAQVFFEQPLRDDYVTDATAFGSPVVKVLNTGTLSPGQNAEIPYCISNAGIENLRLETTSDAYDKGWGYGIYVSAYKSWIRNVSMKTGTGIGADPSAYCEFTDIRIETREEGLEFAYLCNENTFTNIRVTKPADAGKSPVSAIWLNEEGAHDNIVDNCRVNYIPTPLWVTSTAYIVNDTVSNGGNSYRCLEAHTSGTFATDLTAVKWALVSASSDHPSIWVAGKRNKITNTFVNGGNRGSSGIALSLAATGSIVDNCDVINASVNAISVAANYCIITNNRVMNWSQLTAPTVSHHAIAEVGRARDNIITDNIIIGTNKTYSRVAHTTQNWVTSKIYLVGDVIKVSNVGYICLVEHTSGTFSTDLAAVKWKLYGTDILTFPSVVRDNISNNAQLIHQSSYRRDHTGTTSETTIWSATIPVDRIDENGGFKVVLAGLVTGSSTNDAKTVKFTMNNDSATVTPVTMTWTAGQTGSFRAEFEINCTGFGGQVSHGTYWNNSTTSQVNGIHALDITDGDIELKLLATVDNASDAFQFYTIDIKSHGF